MQLPPIPSNSTPASSGRAWVIMLVIASLLLIGGLIAIGAMSFGGRAFVLVLGWLLIGSGVVQIVGALLFRGAGGIGAEIFFGLLSMVLGVLMISFPVLTGSLIALVIVGGLILDAALEGLRAGLSRRPGWIWPVLIALVALGLGAAILFMPRLLLPLLGLLVGVHLVVRGVIMLLAALELRKIARGMSA